MRIVNKYTIVYNKTINKTKQPNNSKSCEAENHIPVRGQAVSPIVRKMSQPVVTIKEKGILNMCTNMKEFQKISEEIFKLEREKVAKKKAMDELDAKIKALKDETASYMKKRQKNELQAGAFVVLYTPYTRPQFNKDAFIANEENGKALYEKYCKTISLKKVTVKLAQ